MATIGKSPSHDKEPMSKFEIYMGTVDPTELKSETKKNEVAGKLADLFAGSQSEKANTQNEKVRLAKDFKIRNKTTAKEQTSDINTFLKKNKYARAALVTNFQREKQKLTGYDALSDRAGEDYMVRNQSDPHISKTMANSNYDQMTESQKQQLQSQHFKGDSLGNSAATPMRPQTAKLNKLKSPNKLIDINSGLVKVPEEYAVLQSAVKSASSKRFTKVYSSHGGLNPKPFEHRGIELYNKAVGQNFIKRIENRAMSATRKLKTNFKVSTLSADVNNKYKMLILNWAQELEKHDRILQKFHIFSPLKYDIDATFHKLFSSKTKELIKQKLKYKKKNNLLKAGYLENEIDILFAHEAGLGAQKFEQEELMMGNKYEELENKQKYASRNHTRGKTATRIVSPNPLEVSSKGQTQVVHSIKDLNLENVAENDSNAQDDDLPSEGMIAIDPDEDDEPELVVNADIRTHRQVRIADDPRIHSPSEGYDSPFKKDTFNADDNETQFKLSRNLDFEEEFPDRDVQMKIRDKDVVFMYEIDEIIKEFVSKKGDSPLDEETEILDVLNRYSKLFRHYIRYRVVDIGDLIGGLFLDGFWKTLLITIDKIIQSIDNRCKLKVQKMHKEFEKLNQLMVKRLAEKDEEIRMMDRTDLINDLERKLKLLKEEKLKYQKIAQDK